MRQNSIGLFLWTFALAVLTIIPATANASADARFPFLDVVRLYHYVGCALRARCTLGDEQPFSQRVVRHSNFIMPVRLAPGVNRIYLRLASAGTIEAPLRI